MNETRANIVSLKTWFLSISILAFPLALAAVGRTIYVDAGANGANDGSTWEHAFRYLQDAISATSGGDEILVAGGVYRPDQGAGIAPRDRQAAFRLKNSVAIRGGYAGSNRPRNPHARNVAAYPAILSGDLAGNDLPVSNPEDLWEESERSRADNSYHLVVGTGVGSTAVLDGFTISAGNANATAPPLYSGGGLYCDRANPTIVGCTFTGNNARSGGGGMYNESASPTLTDCTFIANRATEGAGLYNQWAESRPILIGCRFLNNFSGYGALASRFGRPNIVNCIFEGNRAAYCAGAILNSREAQASLVNCLLVGNSAGSGGAMCCETDALVTLTNCTFAANAAANGSAVHFYCLSGGAPSRFQAANCIFADGGNEISKQDGSSITITYSDIKSGWPGVGNVDFDPLFVDAANQDYRLQRLSPCINAGDVSAVPQSVTTDLDGNPRILDGVVDMGAYETQGPRTIYVDLDANGLNNGSAWADAYNHLQDALGASAHGDEIRVAQGTYKPDRGAGLTPGDRELSFELRSGVKVRGGYAGFAEPDPDARDIALYKTTLCGDLEGDDIELWYVEHREGARSRTDNSYHVVTATGVDSATAIEGFTISGGYASGLSGKNDQGGGMYICEAAPNIADCTFRDNWAMNYGGGMCNDSSCGTVVTDCLFTRNSSTDGAAVDNEHSNPQFFRCTFVHNWVSDYNSDSYGGAGMYNFHSNPTLHNCLFAVNGAPGWGDGGGMQNRNSSPTLTNCTFVGNHADGTAGGIYNQYEGSPKLTNCILWGNRRESQHHEAAQIYGGSPVINYCCIEGWTGGLGGAGNFDADPLFVTTVVWDRTDTWDNFLIEGDYHLRSQAGRWDPKAKTWVQDAQTSPCIDAGDALAPIGPEPFPNGGIVNIGTYGATSEASKSYFGVSPCRTIVAGDINGDCTVDFGDFTLMATHWLGGPNP
jgi:hypothetical protein